MTENSLVTNIKYKTQLCANWPNCKYKDKCQFAHGFHELQDKTKYYCQSFLKCGKCFNSNCSYLHVKKCKYGSQCIYGKSCIFYHPPEEKNIQLQQRQDVEEKS